MEAKEFNNLLKEIKYNKSAITRIYEEYVSEVKLHLTRRFKEAVDVDDITHEVFLKLMQTDWTEQETVNSPSSWLFKIADHMALDEIKKKNISYPLDDYENSLSYFNVDNLLIAKDIKSALGFLDKLTAQIIYLNKYEGYKFEDIATLLSMKPISVRVRASRGYKKLKKICNKNHLDFV